MVICPGGWTFRHVVQAACSEDIDIGRQALEERAAHLWIEGDLVACRPTDVPGVDQYVTTQQGHDLSGIDLGRWIVADRRDVDDAVEEPRALEYSFGRCGLAPSGRRSKTSWKPITCSRTPRASQAPQGD